MTMMAGDTPAPSSFGRRLKSRETDLEIVIGEEKEVFHYHSVIMASCSEHIDTMLAAPMKEQDTMRLSFPDIQPDAWKKMIAFLEPGGHRNMSLLETCELLPLFDEYSFLSAVEVCDSIFEDLFTDNPGTAALDAETMIIIAVLSLEYSLYIFKKRRILEDDQSYHSLIPLIQDDESALKDILSLFIGENEEQEKSFEEAQEFVMKETFPALFRDTALAIRDQEELSRKLEAKNLQVFNAGMESTNGSYERVSKFNHPGVMAHAYENSPGGLDKTVIRALDPFGNQ